MDYLNEDFSYQLDPVYILDQINKTSRRIDTLIDMMCAMFGLTIGIIIYIILT